MYYIVKKDNEESFWYDYICGCHVWKSKPRANSYYTSKSAMKEVTHYQIEDGKIIYIEEGE